MSGGSMDYLHEKVSSASFEKDTPLRRAFFNHLQLVAKALYDIEWVDSGNCPRGSEDDAIRSCISPTDVLSTVTKEAQDALEALREELQKVEGGE